MNKRFLRLLPIALFPLLAAAPVPSSLAPSPVKATSVHGDYLETRTASVFAGACHYNGERVTDGRSAVLAWSIAGGSFEGIDLANTRVLAAVACDDNLAETTAARKSEILVDADSDTRAAAAVAWIKSRCGDQLGSVVSVRRATVAFKHDADTFAVSSKNFATMSVRAMPDRACCSQPQNVWYTPLMPIDDRRVGYTTSAEYAGRVGDAWQRSDENSAIYGTFAR